jgi:hypothetical protein
LQKCIKKLNSNYKASRASFVYKFRRVNETLLHKKRYIIFHSDLSKLAAESEPPREAGITKVCSTSTFTFLDLFCGAQLGAGFHRRVFFIEVN